MSFVTWFKKGSTSFFKISSFLNKYISINLSLWSEHIKFMIILWQISCQRCYISSCLDIIYLLSNTKTNKQLHDNYYFLEMKNYLLFLTTKMHIAFMKPICLKNGIFKIAIFYFTHFLFIYFLHNVGKTLDKYLVLSCICTKN